MGFLGVQQSLTGRFWAGPDPDIDRAAEALVQSSGMPRPVCQILARRGVASQDVAGFLTPQLRDLLPNPRDLRDMERAASRIVTAVNARQRIAIFADYDVDGGASAAILIHWLRDLGHTATLYVPDRIDEGYGPNPQAMSQLARAHDLVICVDCGTASHEAILAGSDADTVVLDHHLSGETLPPAYAVVNPNRQDESGDLGHLCAAAVVFLTLVEAGRQLREAGQKGPDLLGLLDLVALATVADVAPLIGVNRALVRQGLRVMSRRERPGLVALADVARMNDAPNSHSLGFLLGPRINAGGRIGRSDLGARLLATANPQEANALATQLDALNTERRAIEETVRAEAMAQAESRGLEAPLVWAAGEGWHPGVVGIVAARLKEATNRPAVVIGFDGPDGKGSGRSVTGIDLGACVQRLAAEGHLQKGGGHRMAAGLSLHRDQLEPAMERLSDLLARQGSAAVGPSDLSLDGVLMPAAATPELVEHLEQAGPYGAGARAPRFALPDLQVRHAREVGSGHLKVSLSDGIGCNLDAIAFGAFDGPLGPALARSDGRRLHAAGRLEINTWGGRRRVQLRLDDAAWANPV